MTQLTTEEKAILSNDQRWSSDTADPSTDLRARVIRGGFWVFGLRITNQFFGLARIIVLARLLAPADFGLFGIALLAMSALETFSQTGFSAALIQKKKDTGPYLDTAWTVQVIRGGVLALIAFLIAPYVAAFFDAPAARPILQVIALSMLLMPPPTRHSATWQISRMTASLLPFSKAASKSTIAISPNLKKIATLSTILQLRDL